MPNAKNDDLIVIRKWNNGNKEMLCLDFDGD